MHPATVYIVIAVLTFGLFSGVNLHEFVDYGDPRIIVHNEIVRAGLGSEGVALAFALEPGVPWQPLAWLSLQAQRDAFGLLAPQPYVWANLVLHVTAALLLLFALARLTDRFWPSAFVAAVYAVHPIAVESVAWASARADVLSNVCFAAVLTSWAFYVERPSRARYTGVAVFAALDVLAGGRFAAVPFLLLVLDVWPLGRVGLGGVRVGRYADRPAVAPVRLVAEKAPLWLIGLAGTAARLVAESGVSSSWGPDPGFFVRTGLVLVNLVEGASRVVWPGGLSFTVPTHWQMGLGPVPLWQAGAAFVLLGSITWGLARLGAAGRPLLAGWLWYLVLTVPVAGFVPAGMRMLHDRSLQLPLVGLALIAAFGGAWGLERLPRREVVGALLAGLLLVPMAAAARAQARVWRSSEALFDHALAVNDRDAMALYYNALRLASDGFENAAEAQLERSIEVYPEHTHANFMLGQLRLEANEPDRALGPLRQAELAMPESPWVRMYIARALMDLQRSEEAMSEIEAAIALDPRNSESYRARAHMYVRLGRFGEAIADYRRILDLNPRDGRARAELGRLERELERAASS